MLIAILSDIHSNIDALDAVLEYIDKQEINVLVCAGDLVGYYLRPNEVIQKISKYTLHCVKGNHDEAIFKEPKNFNRFAIQSLKHNINLLTDKNKLFLKSLKEKEIFELDKKTFLLVHGSLNDPLNDYLFSKDVTRDFFVKNNLNQFDVVVVGQTHIPFIKRFDSTLIINPGSVGQPRDGNNKACFAIYDSDKDKAEIIRVFYDIDKTAQETKDVLYVETANRLYEGK